MGDGMAMRERKRFQSQESFWVRPKWRERQAEAEAGVSCLLNCLITVTSRVPATPFLFFFLFFPPFIIILSDFGDFVLALDFRLFLQDSE